MISNQTFPRLHLSMFNWHSVAVCLRELLSGDWAHWRDILNLGARFLDVSHAAVCWLDGKENHFHQCFHNPQVLTNSAPRQQWLRQPNSLPLKSSQSSQADRQTGTGTRQVDRQPTGLSSFHQSTLLFFSQSDSILAGRQFCSPSSVSDQQTITQQISRRAALSSLYQSRSG